MPVMRGTMTLVQESRFQLTDEDGASHLFLLSPHASAEPAQLAPLVARQARVCVTYKDARNTVALVAQKILVQEILVDKPASESSA